MYNFQIAATTRENTFFCRNELLLSSFNFRDKWMAVIGLLEDKEKPG